MSTASKIFEHNDLRKSTRLSFSARADIGSMKYNVADWSFQGFRILEHTETNRFTTGEIAKVTFAIQHLKVGLFFTHKAFVVRCTDNAVGFQWIDLPSNIHAMLGKYIVSEQPAISHESATTAAIVSSATQSAIQQPYGSEFLGGRIRQRRSHLAGYSIASALLLMAIAYLGYENQFVFSTRAIYPGNLAEVTSVTDGTIDRVLVKPGDIVSPGDIVAVLDTRDLETEITSMEQFAAQRALVVEAARDAVTEASSPIAMYATIANQQSAVARAKVAEARAMMEVRQNEFNRAIKLDQDNLIGKSELDRAKAEADRSDSQHQAAIEQAKLADQVATEAKLGRFFNGTKVDNDLPVLRINLAQRLADFAQAKLDLQRLDTRRHNAAIVARTGGTVFSIERQSGQFVKNGDRVLVLSAEPLPIVVSKFNQKDAERLHPGTAAVVYINGGGQPINARVSAVGYTRISLSHPLASLIGGQNEEVAVELTIDSVPSMLTPGMSLEVKARPDQMRIFGLAFAGD